ncbi:MAG: leucine--tRNA ligase [Gemmatimonadales bacterium]
MSERQKTETMYQPAEIEAKWQARWEERGTNRADLAAAREPYLNLMMFPYPSAEGLHVGNVFAFIGADIHGRYQRLRGKNVFEPIGFDAFGIHSENFALKVNTHPARLIPRNIENFRRQLRRIGLMLDWDHELSTTDARYYKWTQWIFTKLYEAGLAEKREAPVNWCPECKTVLANEQVIDGFCERHGDVRVTQRFLEQWFFKITDYAERLLANLESLDWSDSTRAMQRNWIGRSEGADLVFKTPTGKHITVFTTRPDTTFGATYLVLAPEHPMVEELTTDEQWENVNRYRREAVEKDLVARRVGDRDKTGVFTGSYARNPATGDAVPIWIADYVLMEYGTGAIMAVPAHDERDFEFATKFELPIVQVVETDDPDLQLPFTTKEGRMINSGRFDGVDCVQAIGSVTAWLERQSLGKAKVQYRLHDWCISRQRYWGPPIPMIYCDACGAVPVPEEDLPVVLPEIDDFKPDESGLSPLARHKDWYEVACPRCGGQATRETDVSDTFLDSAWYFLRYPSTDFDDRAFDEKLTDKWLPVSSYIGGNEHAVLHLMYARFITMALHDIGLLGFEEPFTRFRAHGTIVKDGAKMSKSRGNVVIPDDYIDRWGADTIRMYLMFLGPYQEGGDFRDEGISGIRRFLDKVWQLVDGVSESQGNAVTACERKLHQTIAKAAADIESLHYNTAIAAFMEYVNLLRSNSDSGVRASLVEPLIVMMSPFAPHFAEECWELLDHADSVFDQSWPEFDASRARENEVEVVVQVNGKVRARLAVRAGSPENDVAALATADATVAKFIGGKEIRKRVFVPDRLINLVV